MARLPRLALAHQAHWLIQRGHSGRAVFCDAADRQAYRDALLEAVASERVQVHAYALLETEVHLLATPPTITALSRTMQALGRRYVGAHHRRHGGSGTLWEGRFRCAVVEPGVALLDVLTLIDGWAGENFVTSLAHRTGGAADALLVDPPEYWQLGNTPFERQARWRHRIADGLSAKRQAALLAAALGNWAVGTADFGAAVSQSASRPASPRARGRPRSRPIGPG